MSLDLVPIPLTGEALDLTAPDDTLAEAFDHIRDLESQLKEARGLVADELIRRMDTRAKWTTRVGMFEVKAPSPAPSLEYDVDKVRATLAELKQEGVIDGYAEDAAVEPVVTWRVRVRGINALSKLGGDVADRLRACAVEVERPRRVSVRRVAA